MSPSEDSDDEVSVPVSRTRKSKIRSLNSEDEDNAPTLRTSRKSSAKKVRIDSDESTNKTPKKNLKTPSTRSSDRLRKKKEFKLPSRDEVLENVSPGIAKSSTKKMRELKPRRLVNNFIRERNSYASEKVGDIYLTDDSFSDFIDDGDEDEVDEQSNSDDSHSSGNKATKTRKRKKQPSSSSSSGSNNEGHSSRKKKTLKSKKKRTNRVKKKRKAITSSSENETNNENDSDEPLSAYLDRKRNREKQVASNVRKRRTSSRRKIFDSSESSIDEDKLDETDSPEKPSNAQPVRRSSRRMKLIEKEQIRNQKYEVIKKGRKKSNVNQSNDASNKEKIKCDDDKKDVLQNLIDHFSSDESDKNFVVSDAEISEEEPESDFEYTFLKLKDSQSPDPQSTEGAFDSSPSKTSIRMRRKQRDQTSKWRRINTKVESDEIEDSESNGNEDYDHGNQLHHAVKDNNLDLIKQILQKEPGSVHELGYRKRSPLHIAALSGNAEVVQLLLKSKANCKLLDKYGFPPIAYAANGHSEALKVFLKNTDIKKVQKLLIQTDSKMSLLHLAIGESRTGEECHERAQCMELLFAHDKETCLDMLYHKDARGRVPLEAAFYASQHKCVRVLLENGANPLSFRTGEDGNLLHFAVESADHFKRLSIEGTDSSLCLREIIEHMKPHLNDKDLNDFTPLMYACESGNDDCLSVLIDAGATVLTKDKYETSPLHLAALAGSTECVQLLLSNGHPVDCVDKSGWPPLLYADFNAKEECVLALMKPKPRQLFILGKLLKRQRTEEDKKKTFKVVKDLLMSLANHDAYYTVFNDFIRINPELLDEYNHGLLQHTWRAILDFNNKHAWFKRKLYALPGTSCWNSSCSLVVKRSDVLGSTMQQIGQVPGNKLRSDSFHVTFENEPGICTGPKREFFICFCKDAVSSSRGLFAETDDCQYSPIPNTYFSKFIPDASQVKSSPCKEIQQERKEEQNNEDISIEDCTDSELLAIDIEATTELAAANNINSTDGVTSNATAGVNDSQVNLDGTTGDIATDNELLPGNGVIGDDATGDVTGDSNDITDSGITADGMTADGVNSDCVTADGITIDDVTDVRVTVDDISDSGITTEGIVIDGVTSSDMTADGVTSSDMTANGVTSSDMTANGVTRSNMTADGVTSNDMTADGVTSSDMTADGVTSSDMTADGVTSSDMTVDAMTSSDMTADGVTSDDIAAGEASLSDMSSQETSSGQQTSSSGSTPYSEESISENSNQNSQETNQDTWISVGKQNVVIPSISLRSKMKQLRLIGRLVGSAICQGMHLNFHLSKPFIKQILGIPLSHPDDLASFDHQLHKNMVVWVQENSVDDLDLPFSIETMNPWTGKLVTVNLTDDEQKTLDDSNKDGYVKLVSQFKLETFIRKELEEFKLGVNEVIPSDLLKFFTADEFSLLMNGVTKIDVEDWRKNTNHDGFEQFPYIIEWFWNIVSKLKEDEKALLLQFSTGSPCVPLGGFANLKGLSSGFKISKHLGMNKIPHAATCFNLLQLSDYDSEKELREKLLIAIRHGSEGFSFS